MKTGEKNKKNKDGAEAVDELLIEGYLLQEQLGKEEDEEEG